MVPALQAVRSLLALKLIGKERKSHVMNLLFDDGLALFAGLNAIPKRSYLAAYSSSLGEQGIRRFMGVWFQHVQRLGLSRSGSLDLDFHSVPANSEQEPLHKHYVSRRSRSQKGVLVFLARDYKKKDGFKRSIELSRQEGLSRQDYCGCEFSLAEAIARRERRASRNAEGTQG